MVRFAQVFSVAFALVVVLALFTAAATSTVSFSAYNGAWDGGSRLGDELDALGVESLSLAEVEDYDALPVEGTVVVVLSPETAYTPAEAERVAAFVREGGTLVVAEDFGPHSNPLLEAVGAAARVDGRLLRDDQYYYRASGFPVATVRPDVLPSSEVVVLNHATAVTVNGATVAADSSRYAYLDTDNDARIDPEETLGPYAVATVESVGEGRVVVLGDPSVLINTMLDWSGNRALLAALVGDADRVALDVSHRTGTPPFAVAVTTVRENPLLGAGVGLAGILLVAVWAELFGALAARLPPWLRRRPAPVRTGGVDPDAVATRLAARHPDWDVARVRRVAEALARSNLDPDDRR